MSEWVSEWVTRSLSYLPLRNLKPLLHPASVSKSVTLRGQVAAASGLSSNWALRDSDKSTGEQKGSRQFAAPADVRLHQNVWNSLTLDGFVIGCKMQQHCFWVCPCEQRNHIYHTCAIYVNKSLLPVHRWLMYSCLQHVPVKRLVWVQCVEHFLREGAWDPAVWRSSPPLIHLESVSRSSPIGLQPVIVASWSWRHSRMRLLPVLWWMTKKHHPVLFWCIIRNPVFLCSWERPTAWSALLFPQVSDFYHPLI